MVKYTTPVLPLDVPGWDLTQQQDVYVSIEQNKIEIEKRGADLIISVETVSQVPTSHILVTLTQEETARFNEKFNAEIQVNWIDSSNMRKATDIVQVPVTRNLLNKVIAYGD